MISATRTMHPLPVRPVDGWSMQPGPTRPTEPGNDGDRRPLPTRPLAARDAGSSARLVQPLPVRPC